MWTAEIGHNAGIIWAALNKNGAMAIAALRESTELDEKQCLLALGWLAREHKIHAEKQGKALVFHLTGH